MIFKEMKTSNDVRFIGKNGWIETFNPTPEILYIFYTDGIKGHDTNTERMYIGFVNSTEVQLDGEVAYDIWFGFTDGVYPSRDFSTIEKM
jgi:hypothetical protein